MPPEDDSARLMIRQALIEAGERNRKHLMEAAASHKAEEPPDSDPFAISAASISEPRIDLFDPEVLRRKLPQPNVPDAGWGIETGENDPSSPPRASDDSVAAWEARIRSILKDPRGPKRWLLVASEPMLERIEELKDICPGLETAIDIILRAGHLSCITGAPLRVPPLLLQGPPGVGKTHFARHLARTLGVPFEFTAMDLLSERGTLTGLAPAWKAAKPGKIAEALLASDIATCLFVCDEVDKVSAIHQYEKPLAFLHTVLETENAKAFTDEYLAFPMRADHCIWIFTSNDETVLPPSILDRLLILRIPAPSYTQMLKIAGHMYRETNATLGNWFIPEPDEAVLSALARCNPRRAVRILGLAMGFAAQEGRPVLTPSDIAAASPLVESQESSRERAGFVHHRRGE